MKFINNVKATFASTEVSNDRADLVQTVLLIAGFAIAALVLVNWLSTAILNQASNAAACIEGSNTYGKGGAVEKCEAGDTSNKSYTDDESYQGRYGN